jgi:hypothetical protein
MRGSTSTTTWLLLALALPALATAQGLGDAAKKEKARRKTADPATGTRTYTETDLKGLPPIANEGDKTTGAADGATGSAPGPAEATDRPASGEDALRARDEQMWRDRLAKADARLEAARRAHETLSSLSLVPGYVYQDAHGRTVIGSVEQLQQMTARAKADLDAAQKAREDLLEEARRANVPPGWLR